MFSVKFKSGKKEDIEELAEWIIRRWKNKSGIVYCSTVK